MSAISYYQISRRRNMWYKRLLAEWKYCSGSTFFCTLTYDDTHLPCEFDGDELLFLKTSKRDIQLFMKRVRKLYSDSLGTIRYFLVSEFGDNYGRPHYHLLLFTEHRCSQEFILRVLHKCWRGGYILDAQYLKSSGGIRYLTNYISKQFCDVRTFTLMSRRPGIGYRYIERFRKFHRLSIRPDPFIFDRNLLSYNVKKLNSRRFFALSMSNVKANSELKPSLPRYFSNKLYTEQERKTMFNFYLNDYYGKLFSFTALERIDFLAKNFAKQEAREILCERRERDNLFKHSSFDRFQSRRM